MIEHSLTVSELRMFSAARPDPAADFDASCMLIWQTPTVVWVRLLKGALTRALMAELLQWLQAQGVHTVLARRVDGRVLPMGRKRADGTYEIDLPALAARVSPLRRPAP